MSETKVPKLTREQAAIIGLYTRICCGPFANEPHIINTRSYTLISQWGGHDV